MAPPPKPPVICYDLYSDMAQARPRRYQHDPLSQAHRTIYSKSTTSAVTKRVPPPPIVERRPSPPPPPQAHFYSQQRPQLQQQSPPRHYHQYQYHKPTTCSVTPITTPFYVKYVKDNGYNNSNACAHNSNRLRYDYGERVRREQEEKAKLKAERMLHQSMKEQIEQLTAQLDSIKQAQDHMAKQYGMGHSTAKYLQDKEEEIAELRREIEQCRELRRREAAKHAQQLKQLMMRQRERSAEKRNLRNVTNLTPNRRSMAGALRSSTPNSISSPSHSTSSATTSSQQTSNSQRSALSSSTVSFSSSSSSASTDSSTRTKANDKSYIAKNKNTFVKANGHLVGTPQLTKQANRHVTINATPFKTPPSHTPTSTPMFFHTAPMDDDTLEVTDMNFFEKVEDKTMMEFQNVRDRLVSTLKKVQYI